MVQAQKKRRGKTRGKLSIPKWMTPEMVGWLSNQAGIDLEKKVESFNEFVQDAQELNRGQTNKKGPERIIAYKKVLQDTKETLDTLKSAFSNRKVKQDFHKEFDVPLYKINKFHQKIKRKYRKYRSDYVWAKKRADRGKKAQKPQKEEEIMVFTLEDIEGGQAPEKKLASAVPKRNEERKPVKAVEEARFKKWVSQHVPKYKELEKEAREYREEAEDAKDDVIFYSKKGNLFKLRKSLDRLFKNRHLEIETERELAKELEALSKEFPEKRGLKKEAKQIRTSSDNKTLFPFSDKIQKVMDAIDYSYHRKKRVRGGNPVQERMKKYLLEQAKKFVNQYKHPPNEALKIMDTIEAAAYDEEVNDVEMISLVTGIEPGEEEFASIQIAARGAANEAARKEEVKLARAMKKKGKGGPKA